MIVSTATVALQEQLIHKDLPRLAGIIPELTFNILKGRARYVCQSRLESVIEGVVPGSESACPAARRKAIPASSSACTWSAWTS